MHLTLVVLLVLIPSITTLKCYVCNSNEDFACSSSTIEDLNAFEKECDKTLIDPHCRTITQTIDKVKSTVRSCGSRATSKTCYKTAGLNNANVCSCKTDLCNSAPQFNRAQLIMTILSSIIVMAIAILMFH